MRDLHHVRQDRHWLGAERLRFYPWALVIWYLLVALLFWSRAEGITVHGQAIGGDFIAYWSASDLALDGRAVDAYDRAAVGRLQQALMPAREGLAPWIYPPTFLLLVLPLALLPYLWSYAAFMALGLAACASVLRWIAPREAGLLLLLAFPGSFEAVVHGQNGFLTVALAGAGLHWLPTRPLLAGVAFGLLSFKPQLGLLIPVALLAAGQWRTIASATVTTLLFLAISLAVFGVETLTAFADTLATSASWLDGGTFRLFKMPTFFALAQLAGFGTGVAWMSHGLVLMIVAWLVVRVWRRCPHHRLRAAVLAAGVLLASPYFFDYDFIWLSLPMAFLAAHALEQGWQRGEREALLLVWLLPLLVSQLHGLIPAPLAAPPLLAFFLMLVRRALQSPAAAPSDAGVAPCPR